MGFGKDLAHVLHHVVERELLCAEVHRDLDIFEALFHPLARLLAGHAQNQRSHRDNQAGLLGNGNEFGRRHDSLLGIVPADKRLETHDGVASGNIHNGLVHQNEFLGLDSAADFVLELVELHRLFADAAGKELDATVVAVLLEVA